VSGPVRSCACAERVAVSYYRGGPRAHIAIAICLADIISGGSMPAPGTLRLAARPPELRAEGPPSAASGLSGHAPPLAPGAAPRRYRVCKNRQQASLPWQQTCWIITLSPTSPQVWLAISPTFRPLGLPYLAGILDCSPARCCWSAGGSLLLTQPSLRSPWQHPPAAPVASA